MSNNIKIQLKEAKRLYDSLKYEESLELFEQLYSENPEAFTRNELISYCWSIYKVRVKNFKDENELFDATDFICDLIPQANLNYKRICPYTFSVFIVLELLYKRNEFYNLSYWLDKINPKLLDLKRTKKNGRFERSRKEAYYDYSSKSYLECAEWEQCIQISKEALETLRVFTFDGDTWHRWRIAKSLRQLNRIDEALAYLDEVVNVKNDWFIYREFAENYHMLNEDEKALKYVCEAVLTNDSIKSKVNLFHLAYEILDSLNEDMAFRHLELYYLLKRENNAQIPEEIESLDIDEDELDKGELINEIKNYWMNFKFKNQELKYGIITKFFDNKNYGFITDKNHESIFFHKSEFRGENIYVGEEVSFYTEKSFDKSKNKESLKAVCIGGL